MGYRYERWCIRPAQAPRPWRYCSGCGSVSEFVCTGRFRTNAQKKCIDVWLKYLCSGCSAAWKLPVLERVAVAEVDGALLQAFAHHDPAVVDRYACDIGRLRPHAVRVETDVGYTVERTVVRNEGEGLEIEMQVPGACELRLDRLLASELRVSRGRVSSGCERGWIAVVAAPRDPLRRPVRDGQRVRIEDQFFETREPL